MLVKDERGNELLEILQVEEGEIDKLYHPVTHALLVVKIGQDYLMGWNHWRKDWEIFGGCREEGETLRECIVREAAEEIGLHNLNCSYIGLMKYKMAPSYFSPDWREEYGALYGVTLPLEMLEMIEKYRSDREEVEKLAFYDEIEPGEMIAVIDEKLLEYWKDDCVEKKKLCRMAAELP